MYELIRDYDGNESKTLEDYCENEALLEGSLPFLVEKLSGLRDYLIKNDIITMGLFPENILFQRIDDNKTIVRIVNDMGSAALIPLEYYVSFVAKKRIGKRWQRFLQTLLEMYPNDIMKNLIKSIA